MTRISRSIPFFIILSICQVEVEGKCKCVDYDRDWYVIVASFASGLILSAILAFLLKCYFRPCGRVKAHAPTAESQETLETQSEGDLTDQLYEEVPDAENGDFVAIGSFGQALRSDSMESRTNLVVDVTHHGEPTADYQYPGFEREPIYSDCGMPEDKSNGQSGSDENDGTRQSDYQHPSSNYQHPEPNHTNMDMTVQQETNLQPESEVDYQKPAKFTPSKPPRNLKSSPPPSERYKKPPIKIWKAPTNYKTASEQALQTKYLAPSPELVPSSPPSDHATDDRKRKDYHLFLDTDIIFLEGGEQNREDEMAASSTKPSSGQNLPTAVNFQPPSPNSVINEKSNCEADYQISEIDAEFPENEGFNEPQPTPSLSHVESDREAGYQVPEIDAEFLENAGFNRPQPTLSLSHVESDREAGYQVLEIDAEFLENEAYNAPHPSPSLGNVEKNRETSYQVPDIDMRFFESGDKSLIPPTPALPSRPPTQKAPSTSLVPPALPSNTPPQNSPFAKPTKASTNSEAPALPSKTSSQKSPSVRPSMVATSSPSPTLPVKAQSVKSPKMVPSKSLITPQAPPKAAPPLPAKTKPVSSQSPAFYAELNELDREDYAENYQHLTPTTKQ